MGGGGSGFDYQLEWSADGTWVNKEFSLLAQKGSAAGIPSVHSRTSPLSYYLDILRYFEEEVFHREKIELIIQVYKNDIV